MTEPLPAKSEQKFTHVNFLLRRQCGLVVG
jgi:hypothetical protein